MPSICPYVGSFVGATLGYDKITKFFAVGVDEGVGVGDGVPIEGIGVGELPGDGVELELQPPVATTASTNPASATTVAVLSVRTVSEMNNL